MPKGNFPLLAFNRGLVSASALSRVDVERIRLSAEVYENFIAKTQGAMMLRPGLEYLGNNLSNLRARGMDFVASTEDTALLELTSGSMRVWLDDELLTRTAVSTTLSDPDMATG